MIMKKMYISPRMETIVLMSNVIATSVGGDTQGSGDVGFTGFDNDEKPYGEGDLGAPTRGGRF